MNFNPNLIQKNNSEYYTKANDISTLTSDISAPFGTKISLFGEDLSNSLLHQTMIYLYQMMQKYH